MERGAGRYWTEDEIRALLSVWSEKSIKKQLHGTLRNKGLFMYIAKRMQQLGVFRDWKQCRAKYKNLKYEYRAIKCGTSFGDGSKMRFYDELDAILGSETVAELAENEERSPNLETEMHLDSINPRDQVEVIPGDLTQGDIENSHVMIPSISNEGGKHWTDREIQALINIWSDKNIRWQLKGTVRNQGIFEHIASLLQKEGIDRDWRQCRTKYKNLKHEYVVLKRAKESGNRTKTMKYFDELDVILCSKSSGHRKSLNITDMQESRTWNDYSATNSLSVAGDKEEAPVYHFDIGRYSSKSAAVCSSQTITPEPPIVQCLYISNLCSNQVTIKTLTTWSTFQWSYMSIRSAKELLVSSVHTPTSDADLQDFSRAAPFLCNSITCSARRSPRKPCSDSVTMETNAGRLFHASTTLSLNSGKEFGNLNLLSKNISPPKSLIINKIQDCLNRPTRLYTEGGKHWTTEEVKALITIWYDHDIRKQLEGTVRNRRIFEHIARLLQNLGIERDWRQCRTKYKNLKHEYIVTKRALESGYANKTMKFFYILDDIMQNKVSELPSLSVADTTKNVFNSAIAKTDMLHVTVLIKSCSQFDYLKDPHTESAEESSLVKEEHRRKDLNVENNCPEDEDCMSNISDVSGIHHMKNEVDGIGDNSELHEEAENDFRIITISDTGVGRNWSDHEVRALLNVWSDERISRHLGGTFRNRELFEEISQRMMEFGVNRDWKQCRTKYKNLKYEYYGMLRDGSHHSEKTMKFYDEIDSIIQRMPKKSPQETAENCKDLGQCTSKETIKINEDHGYGLSLKRKAPLTEYAISDKRRNLGRDAIEAHSGLPVTQVIGDNQVTENHVTLQDLYQPVRGNSLQTAPQCHQDLSCLGARCSRDMMESSSAELRLGKKINEGKTKEVHELLDHPGCVLMLSKDQITAGNAARKDHMEGKAPIANKTTSCVFKLLQEAGIKTAFLRKCSEAGFIATHCEMIPIEWVCRRIATGSFLKRNLGVKEGYKFSPPKVEMFFKDDANNDPQWSEEQLITAKLNCAGLVIGQAEVDIMSHSTVAIFEILERAWSTQDCTLVDMKIEFGVDVTKKEIVLADVIDNDSWRLWPSGDKTQQKDKQTYRDLKEITPEAMQMVKRNFEWVADRVELLLASKSQSRVVVLMGSISDLAHCEKIKKSCANYGIPCELRVTSAHKGPDETLRIKSEYEGDGIPTVFVAVAGRSNGLGPVLSGNTAYPVINCPPLTADWGAQDVWSSLRMPSGLGCSTVLSPEAAAQFAAQIFGLNNHLIWSKLRSCTLNTWISLKQADSKLRACSI
ncbi:Multifunctional ADE2 [Pelobates cultripes]|uniref:Multifunctional ADE2 n=1 Tax=Pelobates cultripes TaxID=61616 RepID=A0AAD1SFT2_PELCU|nr:Multifunctional ADE2 [Pelobates cultripes]